MKNIENFKIINHGPNQKGKKDFIRTYKLEIINLDNNMSYFLWITPQGEVTYTEGINEYTPTDFEVNLYRIAKNYLIENNLSSNLGVMEVILLQKEYYELLRKKIVVTTEEEQREIESRMDEIKSLVNVSYVGEISNGEEIGVTDNNDYYDALLDHELITVRLSWCMAIYTKLKRKNIITEIDQEILRILEKAINESIIPPVKGVQLVPSSHIHKNILMSVLDIKKIVKIYGTMCSSFFVQNSIVDVIIHDDEVKLVRKKI